MPRWKVEMVYEPKKKLGMFVEIKVLKIFKNIIFNGGCSLDTDLVAYKLWDINILNFELNL